MVGGPRYENGVLIIWDRGTAHQRTQHGPLRRGGIMLQELSWQNLVDTVSSTWSTLIEAVAPEGLFSRDAVDRLVRITYPVAPFNQPGGRRAAARRRGRAAQPGAGGGRRLVAAEHGRALLALAMLLTRFYGVSLEVGGAFGQS